MAFATPVTLALPFRSVVAVEAEKFAEAPVVGAAKETKMPLSGLLKESVTCTCSGRAKGLSTVVLCGVPPLVWITAAEPAEIVKGLLCVEARAAPRAVN